MNQDERTMPSLATEDGQELLFILAELREGQQRIERITREILNDEAPIEEN